MRAGLANERMTECIRSETVGIGRIGMRRIARHDDEYPAQLREVPEAPECLYVRGALAREDALAVAVVGSRLATEYGVGVAEVWAPRWRRAGSPW